MAECDEIMTKSYHVSFLTLKYPFDFMKVKWLNSHILNDLCGCKDLGKFNGIIDSNYLEEEEVENGYFTFSGGW